MNIKRLIAVLFLLIMLVPTSAFAQDDPDSNGFLNDDAIDVLESFQEETGFRSFTDNDIDGSVDQAGLDNITGVIQAVIRIMKYVVGSLAVVFLIITLVRLISAGETSEEQMGKFKKHIGYIIFAIIIVFSFDFFINNVFDITGGDNFLANEDSARRFGTAGSGEVLGVANFIGALVASIAVMSLVISGFKMVANPANEEVQNKMKKHVMYAVAGLILVGVAELVVNGIIFTQGGQTIDVDRGKELIVSLTNFAAGFVSMIAVVSFFYAGYLYIFGVVGEDNTEKVKKILIGGVIGIIIAAGAFAIVNTVIKLDTSSSPDFIENQLDRVQ